MTVKKNYKVGDQVWIHGLTPKNVLVKGTVVKILDSSDISWITNKQYIIEVPTHIEPLLEIRSWETISQDEQGPVGSLRELGELTPIVRQARMVGFDFAEERETDDEPSPEQIHAALEKSQQGTSYQPLVLKEEKRRPRNYRKKKQ